MRCRREIYRRIVVGSRQCRPADLTKRLLIKKVTGSTASPGTETTRRVEWEVVTTRERFRLRGSPSPDGDVPLPDREVLASEAVGAFPYTDAWITKRGHKPSGWPPGNRVTRTRCPRRKIRRAATATWK